MSKKQKKFNQLWSNQTNLGKKFGLSGIALGKILVQHGLKDPETKLATKKAVDDGWARSTPMKDGTPFFMWSSEKVGSLLGQEHKKLSPVEYWVQEVLKIYKQADKLSDEGQDKIGYMMVDCMYDEVPKNIRQEVEVIVKQKIEKY